MGGSGAVSGHDLRPLLTKPHLTTLLIFIQKHWKAGHKKVCVPFAEQAELDPEEEVLRDAAPSEFKVCCGALGLEA